MRSAGWLVEPRIIVIIHPQASASVFPPPPLCGIVVAVLISSHLVVVVVVMVVVVMVVVVMVVVVNNKKERNKKPIFGYRCAGNDCSPSIITFGRGTKKGKVCAGLAGDDYAIFVREDNDDRSLNF